MKTTDEQIGGDHYKKMKIQPIDFILANEIPFCEANAIKYLCRYKSKNGLEDLKKARHYIDMLIEREGPRPGLSREPPLLERLRKEHPGAKTIRLPEVHLPNGIIMAGQVIDLYPGETSE